MRCCQLVSLGAGRLELDCGCYVTNVIFEYVFVKRKMFVVLSCKADKYHALSGIVDRVVGRDYCV